MPTAQTDHKIKVTPVDTAIQTADPNTDNLLHDLQAALQGGTAVYDYFSGHIQALQNLYQTLATSGDSVWIDGVDQHSSTPVRYIDNGSHFMTVGAQIHDQDTLKNGTGSTDTYKQVGTAYVTLTTDQGTSQLMVHTIEYAGYGLGGLMTAPVITAFLKPILRVVGNFIKNLAMKIWNRVSGGGGDEADGDEAADSAEADAGEAAADASEASAEIGGSIFAEVTISVVSKVAFVVGLGIMATMFIIQLLEKQMTNWVKFYNVTAEDIQFGICTTEDSAGAQIAPADVGKTATVTRVSKAPTPPWVTSSATAIYRSDLTFINTNILKGLGYVLSATPSGDFPGFRVMVDIPLAGDNSLYVSLTNDDCNSVWRQQKDQNTDLTMSATSGKYTLQIATNQVSGKSASPIDATEGYNYEHLIVLTDGSVSLDGLSAQQRHALSFMAA